MNLPNFGRTNSQTPTNTSAPSFNHSASTTSPSNNSSVTSSEFPKIDKLKQEGNNHFKKGDYDSAASSYFEVFSSPSDPAYNWTDRLFLTSKS